jgi:hypothetical protein
LLTTTQLQACRHLQYGRVRPTARGPPRVLPHLHVPRVLLPQCVLSPLLQLSPTHHFPSPPPVDIPPSQVNILNGNAKDLILECKSYEAKIAAHGGVELFLGGIGEDGHIAFNEPGSSLQSRTRIKTLAYDTILANARFFGNDISKVPRMALTVGVRTVLDSREVVVVVTGQRKALALSQAIEGGVNHLVRLPALALFFSPISHSTCTVDAVCAPAAPLGAHRRRRGRHRRCVSYPSSWYDLRWLTAPRTELKVKTVKYFKSIERVQEEVEAMHAKLKDDPAEPEQVGSME